eukprot:CAMPEP_0185727590 /NCGR_PEP_ID=MMETSP1171-20130828/3236_1 /TAXON_ID=374046 /ORGANISM="Helicotheca tamensis, Strain CCMP826" /LENGTH=354 /DNA_ID=CAMNT_0028396185 /DNA_START=158 /DNA_END=1222 /DNA_ORIENTATION=+
MSPNDDVAPTVDSQNEPLPPYPPIWSASMRLQHNNVSQLDESTALEWIKPANRKRSLAKIQRRAAEILAYGLGGVFPWYGDILPAVRWESPFGKESRMKIVKVPGVIDAFLDLHQCITGRNESGIVDGYFDACFPHDSGRYKAQSLCFLDVDHMKSETRIHDFPSPGHERWSCSDNSILEQLAGAHVLDYIIGHRDRFYDDRTNNLFFIWNQRTITFVSVDHELDLGSKSIFKFCPFQNWVWSPVLLKYALPSQLRDNIRNVVPLGSKDEFVQKLNASMGGDLDNVARAFEEIASQQNRSMVDEEKQPLSMIDLLWMRVESVADFYNITLENNNDVLDSRGYLVADFYNITLDG